MNTKRQNSINTSFLKDTVKVSVSVPLKNSANPPKRSRLEEIGNSITHGLGSIFSVVAFILMLSSAKTTMQIVGASVYFAGLFVLFTASCLYHAFRYGSAVKRLFRRLKK